jgi:integron integrase
MLALPDELIRPYEALLIQHGILVPQRPYYLKWLRYYWDFCHKYALVPNDRKSLPPFDEKLRAKGQSEFQRQQAHHAIELYYEVVLTERTAGQAPNPSASIPYPAQPASAEPPVRAMAAGQRSPVTVEEPVLIPPTRPIQNTPTAPVQPVSAVGSSPVIQEGPAVEPGHNHPGGTAELRVTGASWVEVYDRLTSAVKVRHYSPKTLQAYRHWTRKFQTFTKSKDPGLLAMDDVKGFLSFLAVDQRVAASSQNQAFNALLFLFTHVLEKEFGKVEGVVRAKRTKYIPVVLSRAEVDRVIHFLADPYDLVAKLLYGCGLRLFECLKLRVQDLNFEMRVLTVHDGKGRKDRTVPMPQALVPALTAQLESVKRLHREDLAAGYAGTFLPGALGEKYKRADRELVWQWLFPAKTLTKVPTTGEYRRYHLHETHVQSAIKQAVQRSQIPKRASAHSFRHSFASHLLQANYDIRTIQELLGHSDVKTTMIYTHTVQSVTLKEAKSPLDF